MSSISSSQGLVLATVMVLSSTVLFLAFSRQQKTFLPDPQLSRNHSSKPQKKTLRSCLSSGGKRKGRKTKRVQFAENVKEPSGNGEEYRKEHKNSTKVERICRNEIPGIRELPANRIALYNGILRDRVHRMECSY